MKLRVTVAAIAVLSALAAAACLTAIQAAQGPNFDKLSDGDRTTFQKRFEQEIWPLLTRHGKDGCIGCHSGKIVSALRTIGVVDKDFRMLLRVGFLLPDDPGSLLSRITARDPKRRMPPTERASWTPAEVAKLREFVADVDKKNQ